MKRWIISCSRTWRGERLVVDSPLDITEARRRLAAGLASRTAAAEYACAYGLGRSAVIDGRLRDGRLRLWVSVGGRNSFRPILRARLQAAGAGCRLVCWLGWHPLTQAIMVLWFCIAIPGFIVNVARTAAALVTGGDTAVQRATAAGVSLVMGLFAVAMSLGGSSQGRDEATCLRDWVKDHLQVTP